MKLPSVGDIVHIVFLDHVEDGDEPIEFEVFGRVIKKDPIFINVGSWLYTQEENCIEDSNIKTWCIVSSTIKTITIKK